MTTVLLVTNGRALVSPSGQPLAGVDAVAAGFPTTGLVGRFDAAEGVTVNGDGDVLNWTCQASGHVVTATGAPRLAASPAGTQSIRIDTNGEWLQGTKATGWPSGAAPRDAFLCWRPGSPSFFGGAGYGAAVSNESYVLSCQDDGVLAFDYFNASIEGSTTDGGWVILRASYDGTTARFYEDETLIGSATVVLNTQLDFINFARSFGGATTYCDLGAYFLYDRVLPDFEAAQLRGYLDTRFTKDTVAPNLSSPSIDTVSSATATATVTTDEGGGALYWAMTTSSTPLTQVEILTAPQPSSIIAVLNPGTITINPTGLLASTPYYLQAMHVDAAGNPSQVVVSAPVTTEAPDTTAPVLSSASGAANGSNAYTGSVTTANDANGVLYHVVTIGATAPTAAQVKSGQNSSGVTAQDGGSQAVTAVGSYNVSGSNLAASTAHYLHFMHEDAAGNQSSVVTASFTTASAGALIGASVSQIAAEIANISQYSPPGSADFTCSNYSQFVAALSSASAGDVIRLDDGFSDSGTRRFTKSNSGARIRIVAQSHFGATVGDWIFQNSSGITIEGVEATTRIRFEDSDDFAILHTEANHVYVIRGENFEIRNNIVDTSWPNPININESRNFFVTNNMFVGSTNDAVQWQGVTDFVLERNACYGVSIPLGSSAHPDACQIRDSFGIRPANSTIRRNMFWDTSNPGGEKGAQGLYLEAVGANMLVEENIGQLKLTDVGVRLRAVPLTIRNNCMMGAILVNNQGGAASQVQVTDNVTSAVGQEYSTGNDGESLGITVSGNIETDSTGTSGVLTLWGTGEDWRHYKAIASGPADSGDARYGQAFIAQLEAEAAARA